MDVRVGLWRKLSVEEFDAFELWCCRRLLRVPWTARRSNQCILKGDQPWDFFGRTDAKAETPILWPPDAKSWLIGKDWCWEGLEAGGEGDDREWDGWMASLTRWTWAGWTLGVGDEQGGLACCSSWGRKESATTEWLKWTELNWQIICQKNSHWMNKWKYTHSPVL